MYSKKCDISKLLSETWSFDSSTRYSRKNNGVVEPQKSIVPVKFRKRIIKNVLFSITFVFLVAILVQPWLSSSIAASNSFEEVLIKRFLEIAESYNSTISDFLKQYFVSSRFMSGIMYDPSLIQCDFPYLKQYVRVASLVYEMHNPHPHYMFMWQNNRFCQIMWDDNSSDSFRLIYLSQISSSSYNSQVFDSYEDFDSPPEIHLINTSMRIDFPSMKVATWSTRTTFIDDGDPNTDLSAISPNVLSNNETFGVTGVVISILEIAENLENIQQSFSCKYLLLNLDNEVMIDDEGGTHLPEYVDQDGFQHYESISNFGSFWQTIYGLGPSLQNLTKITIDELEYMAIRIPVSPMGLTLFTLLLVFSIDENSQQQLFYGSMLLITAIVFLSLVFVIILILLRKSAAKKKKKLNKINQREANFHNGISPQHGVIGNAIHRLRNLQLRFPKKEMFNKIMDSAIANLAEHRKRRFSVTESDCDCEFCRNLIPTPAIDMTSYVFQPAFKKWSIYRTSQFPLYENLGSLSFDWSAHANAPAKELMRLMISIIVEEKLIFAEFDPDSLILFMQHITTKCCKDNVRTAHELSSLNYLLNSFFKNWISSKIDRFVLYMAAFLYSTDSSVVFDAIEEDDFTQATEEVWSSSNTDNFNINRDDNHTNSHNGFSGHNNGFNSGFNNNGHNNSSGFGSSNYLNGNEDNEDDDFSFDEEKNLKMHLTAFQDKKSAISRNIDFIINLLGIFLPTTSLDSPHIHLIDYFKESLSEIMVDVQDSMQFELLGEFSCRVESNEFSVSSDPDDRMLFMKALIMLCHYCPYWSDVSTMVKATERLNYAVFGSNDNENIAEFHYEHASKIVAPWISVFMNFAQMEDVVENLDANINYWKNLI
ncbi:hypothetical protein TRFO_41236 [Tritrichomonas foetus]|uniref:Uncharacterized protein n=1 Tax=Tritrichomonas foetus TaxID=1144522 RepID=A0A1J4L5B5_9EUKA|nr:hypothetical protein TRFO_41236 [Tritrichomonas foetus]|eukprot:OHT17180.1 hypothetical protein TRFO_41236 [Tritrichomonas foetus]